jgi:hypothetical protein
LGLLFVVWAVDSVNSYIQFATGRAILYSPSNVVRLLTGLGNGLLLSTVVVPMFNFSIWRQPRAERILQNWRELGTIALQLVIVAVAAQSRLEFLFYPLVTASLAGLLLTLTMVNSVIAVILLRRENAALDWRQALLPIACGLVMALLEVGSMAVLRHLLPVWLPPAVV